MKKLLLLGAVLLVASTSFADVITVLKGTPASEPETGTTKYNGVGYLPITSKGEILDVTNKVYLKIKPTSNIGPDGSSLLFDFGKLVEGNTSTLVGEFTAQVIKNSDSSETPLALSPSTLTTAFDKGDGTGAGTDTSITSKISIPKDGDGTAGAAIDIGYIDYSLKGSFEGKTKYIGVVQADARIIKSSSTPDSFGALGTFVDKTQRVAVKVSNLPTGV